MQYTDAFASYHPMVNFLYFGLIFVFSMFCMHPVVLMISLLSAMWYYITLRGTKAAGLIFRGILPLFLITALINPAFSHAGQTRLCYLPTGNPLTLESIVYGCAAGMMLAAVLLWFACFSEVFTSDKFVYLFGRIIPAMSLVLSMTLRFVPRFKAQFDQVRQVQATLGRDTANGPLLKRIKNAVACFSIVVTWSMENALETADSMKSRGYGTARRTAYSIYRFSERDKTALCFLLFCGLFLLCGGISGNLYWRYFPSIRGALVQPITVMLATLYLILCSMPIYIDRKEVVLWKKSLQSKV